MNYKKLTSIKILQLKIYAIEHRKSKLLKPVPIQNNRTFFSNILFNSHMAMSVHKKIEIIFSQHFF